MSTTAEKTQEKTQETSERNEAVGKRTIIEAVIKGAKENKTNDQVAEEVGMKPASFSSRVSSIRSELKKDGVHLPYLGRASQESNENLSDFAKELMAKLGVGKPDETQDEANANAEASDDEGDDEGMELSNDSEAKS